MTVSWRIRWPRSPLATWPTNPQPGSGRFDSSNNHSWCIRHLCPWFIGHFHVFKRIQHLDHFPESVNRATLYIGVKTTEIQSTLVIISRANTTSLGVNHQCRGAGAYGVNDIRWAIGLRNNRRVGSNTLGDKIMGSTVISELVCLANYWTNYDVSF